MRISGGWTFKCGTQRVAFVQLGTCFPESCLVADVALPFPTIPSKQPLDKCLVADLGICLVPWTLTDHE